jgi:hypothetical protein
MIEAVVRRLGEEFHKGRLCLVLGAGVSKGVGLPLWGELARHVAETTDRVHFGDFPPDWTCGLLDPEKRRNAVRAAVIREGGDLPWTLSVLNAESESFRAALYPTKVPRNWTQDPSRFDASAIASIAQMAIALAEAHPRRSFHVVTYNFDTLLEEAVAHLGHRAVALTPKGEKPWEAEGPPERRRAAVVRVAHPHGILCRPGETEAECGGLMLDARDYDASSLAPFADHNMWQICAFAGFSCLFYGWSFQDYAVRRLLRVGMTARRCLSNYAGEAKHVALLKRRRAEDGECLPPQALQGAIEDFERLEIDELRELGVQVVPMTRSDFADQHEFLVQLLLEIVEENAARRGSSRAGRV